jgi:hypothetical protein
VLALPLRSAFVISTSLLVRVLEWRLAVGAGIVVWLGAAMLYLRLTG